MQPSIRGRNSANDEVLDDAISTTIMEVDMSSTLKRLLPAASILGAVIALSASPSAVAEPDVCQPSGTVTVCQGPDSAEVDAAPGEQDQLGSETQNGPYGPAGSTPPVGN